jgi:hypothetical protein
MNMIRFLEPVIEVYGLPRPGGVVLGSHRR